MMQISVRNKTHCQSDFCLGGGVSWARLGRSSAGGGGGGTLPLGSADFLTGHFPFLFLAEKTWGRKLTENRWPTKLAKVLPFWAIQAKITSETLSDQARVQAPHNPLSGDHSHGIPQRMISDV